MRNKLPTRDVVLIGAGHTNMHVVRMFRMAPIHGVRLTIVSSFSRATYSGMLPGTLAGLYNAEDMEIDLWRLAAADRIVGFNIVGVQGLGEVELAMKRLAVRVK